MILTDSRIKAGVIACFFISGLCGLIYEVVWARMLGLVFGNTTFAISTILAAFMIGLALGSLLFGRYIDRGSNPLYLYGFLEIGVGVYALFFGLLLNMQESFYFLYQPDSNFITSSLVLFLFCFIILLIPTVLMGGTLPVLIKYFVRRFEDRHTTIGRIYALNTLGAVFGSFFSGYFLILYLGISGTIYFAAALNLLIGAFSLWLGRGLAAQASKVTASKSPAQSNQKPLATSANQQSLLVFAFFLSGFTALVYEVAWTRLFALVLGSSVYAFATMLTAFLFGIVGGSWWFSRSYRIDQVTPALFGLLEVVIGVYCILLIPGFDWITQASSTIHGLFHDSFALLQAAQFLLCFLVMVFPTSLFGATFPIVSTLYLRKSEHLGEDVGRIYFANTIGSTFGSFLAGFVLIPVIGIRNSIILGAAINLLIGNLLLFENSKRRWWVPVLSVAVLFSSFFLQFDRQLLTSGVFLYGYGGTLKETVARHPILFYAEGVSAVVSVHETTTIPDGKVRFLRVNGKTDASDSADMVTQTMLGYLPMLVADVKDHVAIVGLGSGVTADAVRRHNPKQIDVIEIEPEMIPAAKFFSHVNRNVLDDKRVRTIIGDGRHFLQSSSQIYDIIISEPSNPWISGIGNLFSDDFYRTARKKLRPDGIFVQWLYGNYIDPDTFKITIKTFIDNFPNAGLWACAPGHYMLIARNNSSALPLSIAELANRIRQHPTAAADLAAIGIRGAEQLKSYHLLDGPAITRLTAGYPLNTDDHPLLEFLAPRSMHLNSTQTNLDEIDKFRQK